MLDHYIWEAVQSTGKRQGTIFVTLDMAKKLDAQHGPQRPVVKDQIARFTETMARGRWVDDAGGALLLDVESRLRGGQHRIKSQIAAGVDISYNIRWDQTEEEIAADNEGGKPWRAVDIAATDGVRLPNAMLRQSIATTLLILDHVDGEIGGQPHWNPDKLTVAQMVNDKRVVRAAEIASSIGGVIRQANQTAIGVMYAVLVNASPELAPYFFESLRSGVGLEEEMPVLTLRNMLIGASFKNIKQKKWQTMHVTARAWNYHVENKTVAKLQRFHPNSNRPVRPYGWKPFFPAK